MDLNINLKLGSIQAFSPKVIAVWHNPIEASSSIYAHRDMSLMTFFGRKQRFIYQIISIQIVPRIHSGTE
jgi:hypothetical protein